MSSTVRVLILNKKLFLIAHGILITTLCSIFYIVMDCASLKLTLVLWVAPVSTLLSWLALPLYLSTCHWLTCWHLSSHLASHRWIHLASCHRSLLLLLIHGVKLLLSLTLTCLPLRVCCILALVPLRREVLLWLWWWLLLLLLWKILALVE